MKPEFDRFISKVNKTTTCWLWTGTTYRFGYGHFRRKLNGQWKMSKAHRYSYEYFKGDPTGKLVCHSCDNPSCVNPDHLWLGTSKDNTKDMFIKQRRNKYIINPNNRNLNLKIANEIRMIKQESPKLKLKEIAFKYNTSVSQVSRILKNQIWLEEN